jgi:hypothetical protein
MAPRPWRGRVFHWIEFNDRAKAYVDLRDLRGNGSAVRVGRDGAGETFQPLASFLVGFSAYRIHLIPKNTFAH